MLDPVAPAVTVIHASLLTAVHEQFVPVTTDADKADEPVEGADTLVGVRMYSHASVPCGAKLHTMRASGFVMRCGRLDSWPAYREAWASTTERAINRRRVRELMGLTS